MSRVDTKDIEFASRFNSSEYRRSSDREAEIAALMSQRKDRGGSQGMGRYSGFSSPQIHPLGQNEREHGNGIDFTMGPNRSNPNLVGPHSISPFNHHHLYRSPPSPQSHSPIHEQGTLYQSPPIPDRDIPSRQAQSTGPTLLPNSANHLSRSTLLWGNFEPWMDEEYAKQVCSLMGWDPVNIKIPHPAPDPNTGQQANNPGYCFLTFPTPAHAASILAQINNNGKDSAMTMPNSSKPFALNWAPAGPPPSASAYPPTASPAYPANSQQYQKEYSIFVGDLAPETSNSDLVAVFRNPVLGLRNDREPKFIRPFLSCKSAKIMLDPVTGVSRGYGFVRFTDEADQQRALIEMHGLYCLSRPMRISPATAKFKPPLPSEFPHGTFNPPLPTVDSQSVTVALPLSAGTQTKSVSAPIAATNSNNSLGSSSVQGSSSSISLGGSSSGASLSSGTTSNFPQGLSGKDENSAGFNNGSNVPSQISETQLRQLLGQNDGYLINEESWKHHAQARAILSNLIGPNGEQLTSTDPYNTTVFVGGLSPLISEETLRTFFAPFGDIHYVKVPVGKHCGFVQFVRKADAERAIEKMQGFPIGGSRIRLSWGRSQYKAAQAAAQAAQAAALQSYYSTPTSPTNTSMTPDQALQLLSKLSQQGYVLPIPGATNEMNPPNANANDPFAVNVTSNLGPRPGLDGLQASDSYASAGYLPPPDLHRALSNFSPFSPDPNTFNEEVNLREAPSYTRSEALPHPSRAYAPGFYPHQLVVQDLKSPKGAPATGKISPSGRPPSTSRYGSYFDMPDRTLGRQEPISHSLPGHTPAVSIHRAEADRDDLEDLNGTLASLDLDRPRIRSEVSPDLSFSYHKPSSPN